MTVRLAATSRELGRPRVRARRAWTVRGGAGAGRSIRLMIRDDPDLKKFSI
jgi:hypothetical protein